MLRGLAGRSEQQNDHAPSLDHMWSFEVVIGAGKYTNEHLASIGKFGTKIARCVSMEKTKKCAHPSCCCNSVEGSDYCSTYCEGSAKTADILCSCGHAGCVVLTK